MKECLEFSPEQSSHCLQVMASRVLFLFTPRGFGRMQVVIAQAVSHEQRLLRLKVWVGRLIGGGTQWLSWDGA